MASAQLFSSAGRPDWGECGSVSSSSNVVDAYVGARLRMRRVMLGMSQGKLGQLLGVTFQQIQKYEKGANRISASRLRQASHVLEVPVEFFYEGAPTPAAAGAAESGTQPFDIAFLATTEGFQLNRAFLRIRDPKVRRRIVELVVSLAPPDEDGSGPVR
jgi:transcriptional regulator with XRE-family HTH domain